MRYIAPFTNFGGVRCWLLVGLASVNELSEVTVVLLVTLRFLFATELDIKYYIYYLSWGSSMPNSISYLSS